MPRRKVVAKREILPDPKYRDETLAKFINVLMERGKKALAEKVTYGALDDISKKSKGGTPLELFNRALDNVRPMVEVKSRRVGGATYQVPIEVHHARQTALAMRWLVEAAGKRSEKSMEKRLAGELLDAFERRGGAIKKKDDTHKMAEANKAFAHYRW